MCISHEQSAKSSQGLRRSASHDVMACCKHLSAVLGCNVFRADRNRFPIELCFLEMITEIITKRLLENYFMNSPSDSLLLYGNSLRLKKQAPKFL
jgi:hypothetical protein